MRATVKAAELHPALHMTIVHSGTDAFLPEYYGLQFTVAEAGLEVLACDRYTLGVYTVPLDPETEPIDGAFRLPLPDAKDWLKIVRGLAKTRADVAVSALFDQADLGIATLDHPSGNATVKVAALDKPMTYGRLMPPELEHGPVAFGVDPKHLARFAKTHKGYLRIQPHPKRAIRITDLSDDRFLGLIMPVRIGDDERKEDQ